jgi:hypothetical protein
MYSSKQNPQKRTAGQPKNVPHVCMIQQRQIRRAAGGEQEERGEARRKEGDKEEGRTKRRRRKGGENRVEVGREK